MYLKAFYFGSYATNKNPKLKFTKGNDPNNSWNRVMVLVNCTSKCELSVCEVRSKLLLYFGSNAPDKNPKLKFTKGNYSKNVGIELWFLYTALLLNVM